MSYFVIKAYFFKKRDSICNNEGCSILLIWSDEYCTTQTGTKERQKKKKREYVQGSQDEITKTETHREADHAEQKEIWFLYSIWNRDGTGVASVRAFCLILLTTTVLREAT